MNKTTKIGIAIGGIALIGVGGYFLYKRFFGKKSSLDEQSTIEPIPISSNTTTTTTTRTNNTSTNNTSGTSSNVGCGGNYQGTGFPLKKGSCGIKVRSLQKALGVTADGKFGDETEQALKSRQNLVVANPIGYSAGYGKLSQNDYIDLQFEILKQRQKK